MAAPSLSVLLANYNHARYLDRSLAAICDQSPKPDEIIVVDDGSTDDSVAVIERFARRHRNLKLIRHENNRGVNAAAGRALAEARGDYVAWLASDDEVLPGFFAKALAELARHPGAGLAFAEALVVIEGEAEPQRHPFGLGSTPGYLSPARLIDEMRRRVLWIAPAAALFRRNALMAAGGWRPELAWLSDWFAAHLLAFRHGAVYLPESLSRIHCRADSYSQAGMRDPRRREIVFRALLETLREPGSRDLRAAVRAAPLLLLQPLGPQILATLARSPRDYDLLLPALKTKVAISGGHRLHRWLGRLRRPA